MAINQQLWNIAINLQSIPEVFYQFLSIIYLFFFFRADRSTKHLVDRMSADHIGFLQARVW